MNAQPSMWVLERTAPVIRLRTGRGQGKIPTLRDCSRRVGNVYRVKGQKQPGEGGLVIVVTLVVITTPVDRTVAGAEAFVAVMSPASWLCRILQCRLEIPRVAILIKRQTHHAPELPG